MDDAFDTFRNQRVWACSATPTRFPGQYICPLCRTEVTLASGRIVCDYFRHLRGKEHDECERYSKNFGRDVPLSQHEYEHLDAALIANQTPKEGSLYISFAIRFRPTRNDRGLKFAGHATFVEGARSTTHTIHSRLRQQYFHITGPEKSYLIKAKMSDGEQAQYPVDGFDDDPVVFRAAEGESVRIAKHRSLKPGGYIVVSRKPIIGFLPALQAQPLLTLANLHATLIHIPDDPNANVRRNIRVLLGFEITDKIATYGFLSPARVYELGPDCWEVSKDSEVAIFIRLAPISSQTFNQFLVQHRIDGHLTTQYLARPALKTELVIRFNPGERGADLVRIGLVSASSPVWFLLEINCADDGVPPQCSRIQFQFASGNENKRLKWSSCTLPIMLSDAVRGTAVLRSISNKPNGITIAVSDSKGQRETLPDIDAAQSLLAFLRRAQFPCNLSASGHPDIVIRRGTRVRIQPKRAKQALAVTPHCRMEARLLDAYQRQHASEYSIRSIAL